MAVLVLCGSALGLLTDVRATDAAALLIAFGASVPIVERPRARRWLSVAIIAAFSVADGAWARGRTSSAPLLDWIAAAETHDRAADATVIHGVIAEDAFVTEAGVRLTLDVDRLRAPNGWQRIPGRVQAYVVGDHAVASSPAWTAGRSVTVPIVLRRPQTWLNPGSPSQRWQHH